MAAGSSAFACFFVFFFFFLCFWSPTVLLCAFPSATSVTSAIISGACIYRSVLVVAGVVVGEESPHVYARSDAAALLRVHDPVNSSADWFTYERAATTGAKIWNAFVGLGGEALSI
jgi:hypothetical protein